MNSRDKQINKPKREDEKKKIKNDEKFLNNNSKLGNEYQPTYNGEDVVDSVNNRYMINESSLDYDDQNGTRRQKSKIKYEQNSKQKKEKKEISNKNKAKSIEDEEKIEVSMPIQEDKINEALKSEKQSFKEGLLGSDQELKPEDRLNNNQIKEKSPSINFMRAFFLSKQLQLNIPKETFDFTEKEIEIITKDFTSKLTNNTIKIASETKNIKEIIEKEEKRRNKKYNLNVEIRKEYLKRVNNSISDLNNRIEKIDEKIYIIENTDFQVSSSNVVLENMSKDEFEQANKKMQEYKDILFLKNLDKNLMYKIMKDQLKQLNSQKIILETKISSLNQYKTTIEEEIKNNDQTKPLEIAFSIKNFIDNFDKDTEVAKSKIIKLVKEKKILFDKINSLKNKEKEKVKFVEEEKLEKEKEIIQKKQDEYKENLNKLISKSAQKSEEIKKLPEILRNKLPLDKEYLHISMEKKFKEKEFEQFEKEKILFIQKKLENKGKFNSVSLASIQEFNLLMKEKLLKMQEEKEVLYEIKEKVEKENIEGFKKKIHEINPKSCMNLRIKEQIKSKEFEKLQAFEDKRAKKEKMELFLRKIPEIKASLSKIEEIQHRLLTIHSTSILNISKDEKSLIKKSFSTQRKNKNTSLLYSENLRKNNLKMLYLDLNEENNEPKDDSNLLNNKKIPSSNKFITKNFSLKKNYKTDITTNYSNSEDFLEVSSIKKFLQPLNTKTHLITDNTNDSSDTLNSRFLNKKSKLSSKKSSNLPQIKTNTSNSEQTIFNSHFIQNFSLVTPKQDLQISFDKNKPLTKEYILNNFDFLLFKNQEYDNKCAKKDKIMKLNTDTDEFVKAQDDFANAMIDTIKFKLNLLNGINGVK